MLDAIDGTTDTKFECSFVLGTYEVPEEARNKDSPSDGSRVPRIHFVALKGVEGKTILGIDVGGTDIKLALAMNGKLAALKEYDWFPASFARINHSSNHNSLCVLIQTSDSTAIWDCWRAACCRIGAGDGSACR
jgi:hypothetical protein